MNKSPKVSVLTPLYNTSPTDLRAMMESILGQTFTDFEFLLLNDSPDNKDLEPIVKSYNDPRIKYFTNEKNLGITKSRNKLIDLATGEYLAVVDHDDISMPNRFELEVKFLDKNPHVGVVGGNLIESPNGNTWVQSNFPTNDRAIKLALVNKFGCVPCHPTAMIRRSVLIETGIRYDERWTPCEDHSLWLDLLPHTYFHSLPDVVLKYIWHGDNTTIRHQQRMDDMIPQMIAEARQKFPVLYSEWKWLHNQETMAAKENKLYTKSVCLFGFIPVVKIKYGHGQKKVYLFNHIPVYRTKMN